VLRVDSATSWRRSYPPRANVKRVLPDATAAWAAGVVVVVVVVVVLLLFGGAFALVVLRLSRSV
jgi:hypothetical protein